MERRKRFLINFAYIICILAIIYGVGKYLLPVVVPFIVGFLIAFFVRKISVGLFKNKRKEIQLIILVIFDILIVTTLLILSIVVINQITSINYAGIFTNYIEPAINTVYRKIIDLNEELPTEIAEVLTQAISAIASSLTDILSKVSTYIVNFIKNLISAVPSAIVTAIAVIVSSIYFVLDYEKINKITYKLLPKQVSALIDDLIKFMKDNIFKVLKAYVVIIFITWSELLIGFLIIGIGNPVSLSFLIAIMDILPIVGVGTALIPWFIIEFIFGRYTRGLGLLILYIVITVIRNIIEPKLVGVNLGLPPLLTLVGMIVGLRLFGLGGMIGFPLLFAFLLYLEAEGKIEIFPKNE